MNYGRNWEIAAKRYLRRKASRATDVVDALTILAIGVFSFVVLLLVAVIMISFL